MTDQEEWRPIPGFDGYEVSNLGRVMSYKTGKPRLRKICMNDDGYLHVGLSRDDGPITKKVQGLVMRAFAGPLPEGMHTRHLDGNKLNNALSNLSYGTPVENAADQRRHGTHRNTQATSCPRGHAYDEANTRYSARGRKCRTCHRDWERARHQRKALAAANINIDSTGIAA